MVEVWICMRWWLFYYPLMSVFKKGIAPQRAQPQYFARKAYERVHQNLPVDPVRMFLLILSFHKLGRPCEDLEDLVYQAYVDREIRYLVKKLLASWKLVLFSDNSVSSFFQ